jgi:hypothetical protein
LAPGATWPNGRLEIEIRQHLVVALPRDGRFVQFDLPRLGVERIIVREKRVAVRWPAARARRLKWFGCHVPRGQPRCIAATWPVRIVWRNWARRGRQRGEFAGVALAGGLITAEVALIGSRAAAALGHRSRSCS